MMKLKHATLLCLLILVAGPMSGQVTTGALTGNVRYNSAELPGVTITVASPAMQGTRVGSLYVNGDYNLPSLPPGDYTLTFEMDGMTTQTKTVSVGLARTERVDVAMILAPVAETMTVTAAPLTVLETTEVQSNFTAEFVDDLPIRRSVQAIALLASGVTFTGAGASLDFPDSLIISGAPFYDSLYLVNGALPKSSLFCHERARVDPGPRGLSRKDGRRSLAIP